MLERRHCSFIQIIEQSYRLFVTLVFGILVSFSDMLSDSDINSAAEQVGGAGRAILYIGLALVALIAVMLLIVWLRWRVTWVSAKDDVLLYETGILFKRKVTIPFAKINTIDMGRNLFERVCGVCRLKIDTGAIAAGTKNKSELDLVFSDSEAETIRNYILSRSAQDEGRLRAAGGSALTVQAEPKWTIRARFGDFFLYGLTSSSVWHLFIAFIGVVVFLSQVSDRVLNAIGSILMPYAETAYDTVSRFSLLVLLVDILIAFIAVAVVANIWSILVACVKFYGFRVAREGDTVVVRYGLINLKNYTMPVRNIHSIIVRQNLLQQILGKCSVEMVSVGYGDEKTENSLLFPIIQRGKLDWLINEVLPEYSLDVDIKKCNKRSVRFMVVRPIFWSLLFFTAGAWAISLILDRYALLVIFLTMLMIYIIVTSVLNYRNTGIGWNDRSIVVSSGGTRKAVYYIRTDAVQSVAVGQGPIQRRHGVGTYRIDYHAPMMRSIAMAAHLPDVTWVGDIAEAVDRAKVF